MVSKSNKKGWIRIVEAFTAVLLIAGVSLVIIGDKQIGGMNSSKVYDLEISILREIQTEENLRSAVLSANLPVEWADFESAGMSAVKNKIEEKTEDYLRCEAKLCSVGADCNLRKNVEGDVYVQSGFFSATSTIYSPRQLKIFCWV